MRSPLHFYTILALVLAACALAIVDPEMHTTVSLNVRTCSSMFCCIQLKGAQKLPQEDHLAQKPFAAPDTVFPYGFAEQLPMQAASEAGSAERPVGKIIVAVIISTVLFGLGMGM